MIHNKNILDRLNDYKFISKVRQKQQKLKQLFVEVSLHTLGAAPQFQSLSSGKTVTPRNFFGKEWQDRFDEVLMSKHPRENQATRNWRYSQYRAITREPFAQLSENIIGSIFQDNNYSIIIPDQKDADYILNEPNFDGYDLVGWFANVGFAHMINDANGYFVRMPNKPYGAEHNDSRKVQIYFIPSFHVVEKTEDYILFEKDDYVYYIDKQTIWRYKRNNNGTYYLDKEDANGYYSHLLGYLPVTIAGGFWNEMGYFESFYSKAIPLADEFISTFSAGQLVDKEASHPFIQMVTEQCSHCDGVGKVQQECDTCPNGLEIVQCGRCEGRGQVSYAPADRISAPAEHMDRDLVRIISPDVSINQYHKSKIKELKEDIYRALYLQVVGEDQSGVAKALDLEQKDLFFSKLINHIFDNILYSSIKDIIAYRNVSVDRNGRVRPAVYDFQIVKPKTTRIRTTKDLLEDYKSALDANMPLLTVTQMYIDFMDKQYSGDPLIMKKVNISAYYDKLLCVPAQDRLAKAASGAISKYDLQLSENLPTIMDELILEKGQNWFLNIGIKNIWPFIEQKLTDRGINKADNFTNLDDDSI